MSMRVRVDHEHRCVTVRYEGAELGDAMLVELVGRLRREVPEARHYAVVYDFRSVTQIGSLSTECVRELAADESCGSAAAPERKLVAIVAEADVLFGVGRMFQALSEARLPGLRVFREIAAAREHVGLAAGSDASDVLPEGERAG